MDLIDCRRQGIIKKTTPNKSLIKSLIEMSDTKELAVTTAVITDKTISAYVSMAYDSLRELMEALCIQHGYKVTNHICLGELLKELIKDFQYTQFDRLRYIRNGINYYGKQVGLKQGKELIKKILSMKKELLKKINI